MLACDSPANIVLAVLHGLCAKQQWAESCVGAQVEVPEQLVKELTSHMESTGIPVPDSEERWAMALNALKVLHCSSASLLLHASLVHHSSFVPGSVSAEVHSILHRVLPVLGAGCSKLRLLAGVSLVADHFVNHTQEPCHADRSCPVSSLVSFSCLITTWP